MKKKYDIYTNNTYKYVVGGLAIITLILLYFNNQSNVFSKETSESLISMTLTAMLVCIPLTSYLYSKEVSEAKKQGNEKNIIEVAQRWFTIKIYTVALVTLVSLLCVIFTEDASIFMVIIPGLILLILCKPESITSILNKNQK